MGQGSARKLAVDGGIEKKQCVGPPVPREDHTPGPGPQPLGRIGGVEPPKLQPYADVTAT